MGPRSGPPRRHAHALHETKPVGRAESSRPAGFAKPQPALPILKRHRVCRGRGANCSPVRSRVEWRDPPASASQRDTDRVRTTPMSWIEVTELVTRAQAGDRCAFGELVTRFQGAVFAAALTRLRNYVEAQELTQEVFVHAMRKLPQLRDPRCFAGWLRRITARMAINRLSRHGPRAGIEPEMLDAVAARTHGPADEAERAEERAAVRAGLKRL